MKHKPAFIIDIQLPRRFLDVNLTPDKREVAMMNETYILEKLREAVDALYAPSRFTLPANLIVDTLADTTPNQLQGRILQHFQPTFSANSSTSVISKPFLEDSMDKAEFEDSTPLTGSTEGLRDDLFTNSTAVTALRTPPSQSHTDLLHSDTDTPPGDFNSSSSNPILLQASSGGDMLNTGESKLNNRKSSWTFNAADSLRKYKHNRKKLIGHSQKTSRSIITS